MRGYKLRAAVTLWAKIQSPVKLSLNYRGGPLRLGEDSHFLC